MPALIKVASVFALISSLLFAKSSCQVEATEATASALLLGVEAVGWADVALTEEDEVNILVFPYNLSDGTSSERFTQLTLDFNNDKYPGYQWVSCKFVIKSNINAELKISSVTVIDGERKDQRGTSTYSLIAGEETEVELVISVPTFEEYEKVQLQINFDSALEFTPASEDERVEGEEYVDFAVWSTVEYEISNMRFYGAQTVVS